MKNTIIKNLRYSLLPFSLIFGLVTIIRNKLFDWGILKSEKFNVKVISIGNITVGGTGKTPFAEYLISVLQEKYKAALLSRGYGRTTKGFILAVEKPAPDEIGDEPCQVKTKFPGLTVAVDENRVHGIKKILETNPKTEIIILDDAFQHRYVKPGLSILLIDYTRPIFNDLLLPSGNLREPANGKKRADIVVVTKCPANLTVIEKHKFLHKLKPAPLQKIFYNTFQYGAPFSLLANNAIELNEKETTILLVTGIANPKPLINHLSSVYKEIQTKLFADHHKYTMPDIKKIENTFNNIVTVNKIIMVTEKDAAKLKKFINVSGIIHSYIYIIPVQLKFMFNEQEKFNNLILDYAAKD